MEAEIKLVEGLTTVGMSESNHWIPIDGARDFNGREAVPCLFQQQKEKIDRVPENKLPKFFQIIIGFGLRAQGVCFDNGTAQKCLECRSGAYVNGTVRAGMVGLVQIVTGAALDQNEIPCGSIV